jgi:hypothetical protein
MKKQKHLHKFNVCRLRASVRACNQHGVEDPVSTKQNTCLY